MQKKKTPARATVKKKATAVAKPKVKVSDLFKTPAKSKSNKPNSYAVRTPSAVTGVRG